RALAAEGANIVLASSTSENATAAAAELGDHAIGLAADITAADTPRHLIETAQHHFGRLDGLFVSHGGPPAGTAAELDDDALRRGLELATLGPVRVAREVASELGAGGSIVVLTSTSGAEPLPGLASSNVARPATQGFVKDLANEVGERGVRVNALLPGRYETERAKELARQNPQSQADAEQHTALRRSGQPDELGAIAAFLLSPKA